MTKIAEQIKAELSTGDRAAYELSDTLGLNASSVRGALKVLKDNGIIKITDKLKRQEGSRKGSKVFALIKPTGNNYPNHDIIDLFNTTMVFFENNKNILLKIPENKVYLIQNRSKFQRIADIIENGGL